MRTFFVCLAVTATGCASISNLQTADTLGRGGFQVGIEPGVWSAASTVNTGSSNPNNAVWLPHIDVSARFGVSDGVDLGLRAGLSFLELQSKFLFTKPGDRHIAVSLAPTVGGLVLGGSSTTSSSLGGILNIGLPLLIGIKTAGGSELVIGPRLQSLVLFASSATGGAGLGLGAGSSLGFAWRISDNFGIMPEISVVVPIMGASIFSSQVQTGSALGSGILMFQAKLGLLIGRFRPLNNDVQQAPRALPPPPPPPRAQPQPQPLPSGDPSLPPPPPPPPPAY
ncbi:MAG: hypothetical protein ACOZQL_43380 [Myxococcota bacterium]